ncbi:hypothetical protein Pmani_006234 [Petrolisthes manimaculis]|uniref:WAP domain-containing protein n=1 Tax=Petrolisthes manimaculis TaxID=1843537 RepID=A0AAE1QBC1_9EUCA|nr:hypothetical protein Pmani_006234 [Petrolisthes manimaculis]
MCVRVMVTLAFLVALVLVEGGQGVPSKYREKPGYCPLFPAPPPPPGGPLETRSLVLDPEIPYHSECENDYDCRGANKCCSTGVCCGRICVSP